MVSSCAQSGRVHVAPRRGPLGKVAISDRPETHSQGPCHRRCGTLESWHAEKLSEFEQLRRIDRPERKSVVHVG